MKTDASPLFVQIAETIRARILDYEYGPGDFMPSAGELEKEFKVSNITIRRALNLLAKDGYITPRRGMRAQIAGQPADIVEIEITGDFKSWIDMAVGRKLGITAKILERKVVACPRPIRLILSLDSEEKVERIKRVRVLKGTPISYYINYGPSRLFTQLPSRDIEKRTFVETYQDFCRPKLKFMEQTVRAANADLDLAGILGVKFGFPLFFIQNVYFSAKQKAIAVTRMYYRSDRFVYTIKRRL